MPVPDVVAVEVTDDAPSDASGDPQKAGPPPVRPALLRFHSSPAGATLSPTRHHFRLPNVAPRQVKETLNASYREDETGKRINQYIVKECVGRGTFGMVFLAVDSETNTKYAIKEYSKLMLQKINRNAVMARRRRPAPRRAPLGGDPRSATPAPPDLAGGESGGTDLDMSNPINLIRRELAIMKKADHPNIANLIEVLDDPHGDALFMVLEWCEKGALMPSESAYTGQPSPYTEEQCRLFFRDMILGVEYLHSQGIIHRDIKADNVLLSEDDVVKIVDFGVSEIFERGAADSVKRVVGSPAYMAPELAALSTTTWKEYKIIDGLNSSVISGRAADIWSMGVTLYYMVHGRLPFLADSMVDLYDNILNQQPAVSPETSPELQDLFSRILEKSPTKRITMRELRAHPWVTHRGDDPLLSEEENCAESIAPLTELDLLQAIELMQGRRVDAGHATAKLREMHGWRGQLDPAFGSGAASRDVSVSPGLGATIPGSEDNIGLLKLTAALDEIILRNERRTGRTGITLAPASTTVAAASAAAAAAATTTTMTSTSSPESAASVPAPDTATNDILPMGDADRAPSPPQVERRPSRTRERKLMGLEMTAIRSRSLDTDDRV